MAFYFYLSISSNYVLYFVCLFIFVTNAFNSSLKVTLLNYNYYNLTNCTLQVIGYSVVLTAFALQPVIKKLVKKITGFKRILTVDIYLLFSFFGAVNVWRGVWMMLDAYFIPG